MYVQLCRNEADSDVWFPDEREKASKCWIFIKQTLDDKVSELPQSSIDQQVFIATLLEEVRSEILVDQAVRQCSHCPQCFVSPGYFYSRQERELSN